MMKKSERIFLGLILVSGLILIFVIIQHPGDRKLEEISYVPALKLMGKATQSIGRATTKILPIDSVDEGELGLEIEKLYLPYSKSESGSANLNYLNHLTADIEGVRKKPFHYRVHLLDDSTPNAMALPGGVLLVTIGLLHTLQSEAELVAVLGHEMGHVELSHCMDSVRFEILSRKLQLGSLGELADLANSILLRHTYSKTQEDEADEYGFKVLVESPYQPMAMANAFRRLQASEADGSSSNSRSSSSDPFRDYLMSHPPIEQRLNKARASALAWRSSHVGETRYIGKKNFELRQTKSQAAYSTEESKVE